MKRFLLLGAVLLAAAGSRGVTRAQTQVPTTVTPTPSPVPTVTATPTPAIDPSHFVLSPWSFPAPAAVETSRVESNSQAASEVDAVHFGASFVDEGRLTGYFMVAATPNLDAHGTSHPVLTYYLVSTFATPDAAKSAFTQQKSGWNDSVTLPPAGVTATQVALSGAQPGDLNSGGLYRASFKSSTGDVIDQSEIFEQRGIYLIEVYGEYFDVDAAKYGAASQSAMLSVERALDSVANGTVAGPPKPVIPGKSSISVLSTRFEANGLALNFNKNLKQAPLTSVRAGTRVQASTYFVVKAAKPNSKFSAEFTLTRGKSKFHRKYTHSMGTYPPNYYRDDIHDMQLNVAGKYDLTVRVKVGKVTKSGKAHITVTGHSVRFDDRTTSRNEVAGTLHSNNRIVVLRHAGFSPSR